MDRIQRKKETTLIGERAPGPLGFSCRFDRLVKMRHLKANLDDRKNAGRGGWVGVPT
jgi:hypothetical protein